MNEKAENAKTFEEFFQEIKRDLLMEELFGPWKESMRSDIGRSNKREGGREEERQMVPPSPFE